MKKNKLPDIKFLNKELYYEEKTGELYYKNKGQRKSNLVSCLDVNGYKRVTFGQESYKAHRVIWKMYYKKEPNIIDHIDGNPSNNKIENLRSVEVCENNKNKKMQKNNSTGYCGVYFRGKKYVARIGKNGKVINLGYFVRKEDAIKARLDAEIKYGFSKNHNRKIAP